MYIAYNMYYIYICHIYAHFPSSPMAFFTTAPECAIRASHIQAPSALRQVGGDVGMLHPTAGTPRPGATPFFLGMEKTHRNLRKTMGKTTGKPWEKPWEKPWDVHVFFGNYSGLLGLLWGKHWLETVDFISFSSGYSGRFSLQLIRGGMRWKHHSSDDHMGKHLFFLIIRIYNNR